MNTQRHPDTRVDPLQHSAYHQWLGIYLLRTGDTSIELLAPYRDEFEGQPGYIHPAIITAVAEAAIATLQQHTQEAAASRGLKLEHVAAAPAGNELYANARVADGQLYVEVRTNDDRLLIARAMVHTAARPHTSSTLHQQARQLIYPV